MSELRRSGRMARDGKRQAHAGQPGRHKPLVYLSSGERLETEGVNMHPIDTGESYGRLVMFAKDQPQYEPLPSRVMPDGVLATAWTLSLDERRAILDGANVELFIWTFGRPLQPVAIRIQGVEDTAMVSETEYGKANS